MNIDILAGAARPPATMRAIRPTILLLDSGLGGLTVLREVSRVRPDADIVYAADDAAFPYGAWAEASLTARVVQVVERLVDRHAPDLVVVACNTISTLVLPVLRSRFEIPFVGTVPAIKPAVALSRSGRITVLATPGTVRRDYTRRLVEAYAGACRVDLVGSTRLAGFAEQEMSGAPVADDAIAAELRPCFLDGGGRRTDAVVLACTHYPLLLPRLRRLAPWPVTWIDPAPAIARRVVQIMGERPAAIAAVEPSGSMVFTGPGAVPPRLAAALAGYGLGDIRRNACPLPEQPEH